MCSSNPLNCLSFLLFTLIEWTQVNKLGKADEDNCDCMNKKGNWKRKRHLWEQTNHPHPSPCCNCFPAVSCYTSEISTFFRILFILRWCPLSIAHNPGVYELFLKCFYSKNIYYYIFTSRESSRKLHVFLALSFCFPFLFHNIHIYTHQHLHHQQNDGHHHCHKVTCSLFFRPPPFLSSCRLRMFCAHCKRFFLISASCLTSK